MKAIIMAGGEGQRLRPVSHGSPKPMVRLMGRPIMEHIVLLLKKHGFTDICVTLHRQPEMIKAYFGDGSALGVNICYRQEDKALGTAGGVKNCADFIGEEDVLVISGDAACDFDLALLMEEHRRGQAVATMALAEHPDPLRYGLVVTDRQNRVVSFVEKPDWSRVVTDLVNTGIYILTPLAMSLIPEAENCDFACHIFPKMLEQDIPILACPMDGYWCDVGTPADYLRCSMDALNGLLNLETQGQCLSPGIHCAPRLPSGVKLHPPCHISAGAIIGEGAVIGPEAVINPGSIIGAGATVRSSVIDGGEAGANSTIIGAVVCRGARVKPGSTLNPGTVVAAPGAKSAPDRPPLATRQSNSGLAIGEIACTDRAKLMRHFSEALMEAGADLTDGLVVEKFGGKLRLSPAGDHSAVVLESLSTSGKDADIAKMCMELARDWEI